MDWYQVAQNDWEVYHDPARIQKFADYGKITKEQYDSIVKEG